MSINESINKDQHVSKKFQEPTKKVWVNPIAEMVCPRNSPKSLIFTLYIVSFPSSQRQPVFPSQFWWVQSEEASRGTCLILKQLIQSFQLVAVFVLNILGDPALDRHQFKSRMTLNNCWFCQKTDLSKKKTWAFSFWNRKHFKIKGPSFPSFCISELWIGQLVRLGEATKTLPFPKKITPWLINLKENMGKIPWFPKNDPFFVGVGSRHQHDVAHPKRND